MLGSKIIILSDHAALKYLLTIRESKSRLIRWILLLKEFDLEIVNENFPDESILAVNCQPLPWHAHIINYLVAGLIPEDWDYATRKKFYKEVKHYFYDELELFKLGADDIFRRCVPKVE